MNLTTRKLHFGYASKGKKIVSVGGPCDLLCSTGRLICLLGPNGSGKSTLIRTLSGLLKPLEGEILMDGKNLTTMQSRELALHRSVVLTHREPPPLLKAYDWVALGRHPHSGWSGRLRSEDHRVVSKTIQWVGANEFKDRFLHEMSDGERQRFSIARALAQECPFLLLDEPSTFLDLPSRYSLFSILRKLAHQYQKGIVLSTHELDLSLRMADELWVLDDKNIISGCPEDLILSGQLQKAFSTHDTPVHFRDGRMEVKTGKNELQPIQLIAEGEVRYWTNHALQRLGYQAVSEGSPNIPSLTVNNVEEMEFLWTYQEGNQSAKTYHSLGEFCEYICDRSRK